MSEKNQIVKVAFHGGDIEAVKQGEDVFVSVRRACEHLGIDEEGQRQKLRNHDRAPWAVASMIKATGPDGKQYENFMLHLDSVPMWLATIDAGRVNEEARPLLVAYQKEAARVLKDRFFGTPKPPTHAEALRGWAEAIEQKEKLLLQSKKDEPFINAGKALLTTATSCLIGSFAKSIEIDKKAIRPNKLFDFLRKNDVLFKRDGHNFPYQKHIESGRFIVVQHPPIVTDTGMEKIVFTTRITPKGEGFVINLLLGDKDLEGVAIKVRGKNIREF